MELQDWDGAPRIGWSSGKRIEFQEGDEEISSAWESLTFSSPFPELFQGPSFPWNSCGAPGASSAFLPLPGPGFADASWEQIQGKQSGREGAEEAGLGKSWEAEMTGMLRRLQEPPHGLGYVRNSAGAAKIILE